MTAPDSAHPSDFDLDSRLLATLAAQLKQPLPGPAAQRLCQPELSYGRYFAPAPSTARSAAVLVLLYPSRGQWHLPLTLRPANLVDHAGQISLPGGSIEPGETSAAAALRELEEELGVPSRGISLAGQLSQIYLFRSNFLITPWVATMPAEPRWLPNPAEVAELLSVPLAALGAADQPIIEQRTMLGVTFRAPAFRWAGHSIWGATAMILSELVAVARRFDI